MLLCKDALNEKGKFTLCDSRFSNINSKCCKECLYTKECGNACDFYENEEVCECETLQDSVRG